jgi:hypothetical protein
MVFSYFGVHQHKVMRLKRCLGCLKGWGDSLSTTHAGLWSECVAVNALRQQGGPNTALHPQGLARRKN